jgi:hypothetical protein
MIIHDHEREARILRRRLELLDVLNDILRKSIASGVDADPDGDEVRHITSQFTDVLTPGDVCDGIKSVYRDKPHNFRKWLSRHRHIYSFSLSQTWWRSGVFGIPSFISSS